MLIQTWSDVFATSLQGLWYGFISTVPTILIAIIVFIIGWAVGATLCRAITHLIDALKIDRLFKGTGVEEALARAGWHLHIGRLLGELVKWFVIIAFLRASLELLGLQQVNAFLLEVLRYLPQVFVAALVLVAGVILSDFVRKLITGSAAIANIRSSQMLGAVAYYAIWILAIVTALDKLGIFQYFGHIVFSGIILMVAVAFGLAFGLGGKEAAGRWISRLGEDFSHRK